MLVEAIKANLPLISAVTTDTMNFPEIVKFMTGTKPQKVNMSDENPFKKSGLYWLETHQSPGALDKLYRMLVQQEASLIVLNMGAPPPIFFKVGSVPVPKDMVAALLQSANMDPKIIEEIMPMLGGLTLREIGEVVRLTQATTGKVSSLGIAATRRRCFPASRAVQPVDTEIKVYQPHPELAVYAAKERAFFMDPSTDPRLVPRGLLLDGPPGTGKTLGAKWLANQWKLPLYRIDIAGSKGKYVGESEKALSTALSQVDNEEPCIVLIDEVEKVFKQAESHDSGVSTGMLSQMLWWLQEHRSRVMTIMTTNNASRIPPELIRDGRIDGRLVFGGMLLKDALAFGAMVLHSFVADDSLDKQCEAYLVARMALVEGLHAHAHVTKLVYDFLKEWSNG